MVRENDSYCTLGRHVTSAKQGMDVTKQRKSEYATARSSKRRRSGSKFVTARLGLCALRCKTTRISKSAGKRLTALKRLTKRRN
jgi:hypothetical protein